MSDHPTIAQLFSLKGKTALVTGGAAGIGLGIAGRLVEAGAAVLIVDIDGAAAQRAAAELKAKHAGARVEGLAADVSKGQDATRAVKAAADTFSRLDILVNNAGIFPFAPALQVPEALWDKVMGVNLKGAFLMAQAAANQMVATGHGGVIVNIASIDAFHPTGYLVHYDASKGGVVMMTKALAKEWGAHGIRVNAIAPGGVMTPGAQAAAQAAGGAIDAGGFYAKLPIPRAGTPDEIGRVALFLACEASSYMTGETVVVDGGALVA
jgi:2-deoxy-D-gluconate 3-dehydrogenase